MPAQLIGPGLPNVPDRPQPKYTNENRPIGAKAVLRGRKVVWAGPGWGWQSAKSFQRLKSSGKLTRSFWSDPIGVVGNELRYISRQVAETNRRSPLGRANQRARQLPRGVPIGGRISEEMGGSYGNQTVNNLSAAVTVGAAENAAKLAIAALQKAQGKRAIPPNSRAGNAVERISEAAYLMLGATPPGQQNQFERGLDAMGRSTGTAAVGTAAASALIPSIGSGLVGAAITGGLRLAAGEVLSTMADDNRGGNLVNLGEAATGARLPLSVNVGEDDWIEAGLKSILPNAVPGVLLSGLGEGLGAFKNTRRWLRDRRGIAQQQDARAQLQQAGITETDPTSGATAFRQPEPEVDEAQGRINSFFESIGEKPADQPQTVVGAMRGEQPAAPRQLELGAEPAAAPAAPQPAPTPKADAPAAGGDLEVEGVDISPFDLVYDPELPEADVLLNLVRDLDDTDLQALLAQPGPVVPRIDELLTAREALPVRPELEQGRVMAPSGNVAERIGADGQPLSYEQTLESLNFDVLRDVAAPENNRDLAQLITDTTGREFEEFTKADIIEGLAKYQEQTGQNLLVRDWNQSFRPTAEIQADPQRFQFKQGTNEAGEQIGNSLAGVDRWDTVAEGVIDVWTDPANGITYVVNGHNRLARAKQLGIPTVPVRELPAATAEEARALGALANIKEGRGTVFDAAKFMRDSGITDTDQLQRMGAPMSDGNSAKGLALSKLPGNILQDAVDGRISQGKAIALGGAGFDEGQMQAAVKILGNRDMSDAAFNEVLQQVSSAPVTKPGDNPQTSLLEMLGMSEEALSLAVEKGKLAAKIRADLISDKNLFGKVGKKAERLQQAGNRISVEGSAMEAMDARSVLGVFDAVKYAPGPVSDILDEGAKQIAAGAKPGVVANRIRDQIVDAVRKSASEQGLPSIKPAAGEAPAATAAPTRQDPDVSQLDPETQPWVLGPDREQGEYQHLLDEMEEIARSLGESASRNAEMARRGLEASAGIEDLDGGAITDRIAPSPRLTPEQRRAMQIEVIRRAVDEAEVRPPETPIPELPDGPAVTPDAIDLDGVRGQVTPGTPEAQAVADEIRLAAEYAERDAQMQAIVEEGAKDAADYELKTFEEKKQLGMADGYDVVPPGLELTHGTSQKAAQSIMEGGFRPSRARSGGTILGDGVYMATNPRYAGAYGDTAVGGRLPEGARILDLVGQGKTASDFADEIGVGRPAEVFEGERYFSEAQQGQIRQWALDNGYDGIRFDPVFSEAGAGASEVVIYNTDLANRIAGAGLAPAPVRPEPLQLADGPPIELDTRGKGEFFHGAASEFELERGAEFEGDGMNIYGHGFYVTDDIKTAAGYRKKNAGGAKTGGVVYRITELSPVKLYDLDKPLTKTDAKRLRSSLSTRGKELFDEAIEQFEALPTLAQAMDEMRAWSREFDMPAYEVQEEFFGMQEVLEKQGYGGYTHQGGRLAGKGKRLHQVRIYWDPAEKLAIEKVDPTMTEPRTKTADQAARQQIQANEQRMAEIRRKAQQEGC